ncbi:MAG: hypothetical protein MUD12_06330 [Spirochaetes bacterium]|jgi:hypothetical protein|nr:hypothetical protein [Spirochaetota bacterium]
MMNKSSCSIGNYVPLADDSAVYNPYLLELSEYLGALREAGGDINAGLLDKRHYFTAKYAFPVPTIGVLNAVKRHSPIVEIGAGSGYWAMCLHGLGADIVAYDKFPAGGSFDPSGGNAWFDDCWFNVIDGDETSASHHPGRTLFLCWPPAENSMALSALESYLSSGGKKMIYIGDPASSADVSFHSVLAGLRVIEGRRTPSWPGIDEIMLVCEGV